MNNLDNWLSSKYQLRREDLPINLSRVVHDASRYSKEQTLNAEDINVDPESTVSDAIGQFSRQWMDEALASRKEDEEGLYREGEDMSISDAIAQTRMLFQNLGTGVTLANFPFHLVPKDAHPFVRRALQKEMSRTLNRIAGLDLAKGIFVYGDQELTTALTEELDKQSGN